MTLATAYRNKIDALWLDFHSGGITNPITVIVQISYLMFARLLDISESREEKRAVRLKKDFKRTFPADKQHLRWSHFSHEGGDRMLKIVRDEFFPFMRTNLQQHPLGRYLKDANCLIPSGNLLSRAVAAIDELPLTEGDAKGDIYEHLLGKLSTAGTSTAAALSASSREIDPAAFLQLTADGAELGVGKERLAAGQKARKALRVQHGYGALALGVNPPTREHECRGDLNGSAVECGEFVGEPPTSHSPLRTP
jgi:hypothetical protein